VIPAPASAIGALPPARPFVGPEELAREAGFATLVRLGANESAFGPAPGARAAIAGEIDRVAYYGDPEAAELRAALTSRLACAPENLTFGAGIDDLLGLLVRGWLAPGDVAVMTRGSYPTFGFHALGYGARLETVDYRADGTVDLAALAAAARRHAARVVYLADPDNPSGTSAGHAAVAAFAAQMPPETLLVLDEAYVEFADDAASRGARVVPNVARLRTFSKAYGLAGARIAYAIGTPELRAVLDRIRLHFGVGRLAQVAALAALADDAHLACVVAATVAGRAEYRALGARLGLRTIASQTNFTCFDLGSPERAQAVVRDLLACGVFIRKPGAPPLDGHVRVTVGTPAERATFAAAFEAVLA